jgi:hypothetical protein
MVTAGGDLGEGAAVYAPDQNVVPDPNVADLLQQLNLMAEEKAVVDFCDDEEEVMEATVEWALMGKVLSPVSLHANTIRAARTSAWGNPSGLKIRSIGERGDNLFVAEFGCKADM